MAMSDLSPDQSLSEALEEDRPSDNDESLEATANESEYPSAGPATVAEGEDESDDESLLSEVDEAQFADFDATAVQVAPELETLSTHIKASKRKRVEGEVPPNQKTGRREKPRRPRRRRDSDDGFSGGEEVEGKRIRKHKEIDGLPKEKRSRVSAQQEVDEENLPPEERRRKALDRAMDAALKRPNANRARKGDIDLEQNADEEINELRGRMIKAAETDGLAHDQGLPAFHKIKMLPEVVALLNRNTHLQALTDPDTNLLEAVRFFLEPLNDGALPAYNIQRDLFAAIAKLPINKESLIASGIGKVTLFYTKSRKVELNIKRLAEKLIQEWTRPLLQKSDDHTKKVFQRVAYDPEKKGSAAPDLVQRVKNAAPGEKKSNRARMMKGATGYTIVPESRFAIPNR